MKYAFIIYGTILALVLFTMLNHVNACPAPKIVNHTSTWTKVDQTSFEIAQKRCAKLFNDAPCLKTFIKKSFQTYNAICGGKK